MKITITLIFLIILTGFVYAAWDYVEVGETAWYRYGEEKIFETEDKEYRVLVNSLNYHSCSCNVDGYIGWIEEGETKNMNGIKLEVVDIDTAERRCKVKNKGSAPSLITAPSQSVTVSTLVKPVSNVAEGIQVSSENQSLTKTITIPTTVETKSSGLISKIINFFKSIFG